MTEFASKDALCVPGHYAAIPHAVLRRSDLTPADKLVYVALLDHLRGDEIWVHPGVRRLADMIGLSRRTVLAALLRLEKTGAIQGKHQHRRATYYAFYPAVLAETGASPPRDATPARVQELHPRGEESAPKGVKNLHSDGCRNCTQGGEESAPSYTHSSGNTRTKRRERQVCFDDIWLAAHLEHCYRGTFHFAPTPAWDHAVEVAIADADHGLLWRITPETVRKAYQRSQQAGGFGFGWVMRQAADEAAGEIGRKRAAEVSAGSEKAQTDRRRRQQDEIQREQAKAEDRRRRQREFFDALPPDRQAVYRDQVIARSLVKRPDLIEFFAVQAAWAAEGGEILTTKDTKGTKAVEAVEAVEKGAPA